MIIRGHVLPQLVLYCPNPVKKHKPKPNLTSKFQSVNGIISIRNLRRLSNLLGSPISDPGLLFREKILYLKALNVNLSKAFSVVPDLRITPIESIRSVENCLSSMGIRRPALSRLFNMQPELLTCDPYLDLYPFLDFLLNEVNIPFPEVPKSISKCPRLLVCSVDDQLRPTLLFLKNLGFTGRNAIKWRTTLLLISSVEFTFLPKIRYLKNLGFSHNEVVTMVLRSPGLLTFSIQNNLQPKLDYFLKDMKGKLWELKTFPQYFSYSLEGRIKPRHRRLVQRGVSLSLSDMLKLGDANFNVQLIEMQLQSVDWGQS